MTTLLSTIKSNFGMPVLVSNRDSLVKWDGYDQLEKEDAVKFFSKNNWDKVLEHLRQGGAYYLDEWSVLNTIALSYYARAYFEYMIETLENKKLDEEFVFFLIGALYQVIYIHKGSPFSIAKTEIIKNLVQYANKKAKNKYCFEYFSEDIQETTQQFFNELSKYNS